ncbi:MAG: Amuc_1099 family pilus-like system protein [Roseibacillus sp.]
MKDKYEKVLLGVAALIAIAMIVLGVMKLGKVEEEFPSANERQLGAPPISAEKKIANAISTLSKPPSLSPVRNAKGREVDVFTGVNLFVRRGEDVPKDIDEEKTEPIHPPIPNKWWLNNGLEEEIGYGDAPQLDFDKDGFSNREEFEEKTNPNDKNSFPSLFAKVKVASIDKEQWYLRFSDFGGGALSFRIEGSADKGTRKVENRMKGGKAIMPGETFFDEEPFKGRFKFVEKIEKEVRGIPKPFARVEDLKPGKGNIVHEFASGAHKVLKDDYTARLYLDTPDQRDTKFEIEEGMPFSLPFDPDAKEKPYTLKKIGGDGTSALLLWENNGETKELELKVEN